MNDPAVSDLHRTHRILDSLLPPASELTKHLGPQLLPSNYLELLDSAYGTVEDGDELFAKFMTTLQNDGEKPSAYLHRLHVTLSLTMRRGGVCTEEFDSQLLKQFCRGCWDNALLIDLQLEQKKKHPPSFADLLLLLRTEEDKQATKLNRMKQHLGSIKPASGFTKPRVMSHLMTANAADCPDPLMELEALKKEIANISSQLCNMSSQSPKQKKPKQQMDKTKQSSVKVDYQSVKKKDTKSQSPSVKTNSRPRPWYCFQCGEDGHIVSACENEPNPSLVALKKKQLREKQYQWDASNSSEESKHLN